MEATLALGSHDGCGGDKEACVQQELCNPFPGPCSIVVEGKNEQAVVPQDAMAFGKHTLQTLVEQFRSFAEFVVLDNLICATGKFGLKPLVGILQGKSQPDVEEVGQF